MGLRKSQKTSVKNDFAILHSLRCYSRTISSIVLVTFSSLLFTPVFAINKPIFSKQTPLQSQATKIPKPYTILSLNQKHDDTNNISSISTENPTKDFVTENLLPDNSQNKYQPYFEIGGVKYFNQNSNIAGIYDLFIPLLQTNDQIFFTDLTRIFHQKSGGNLNNPIRFMMI